MSSFKPKKSKSVQRYTSVRTGKLRKSAYMPELAIITRAGTVLIARRSKIYIIDAIRASLK